MKKIIFFVFILFPLFCASQSFSQSVELTFNSAIANYTAGNYEKSIELFTNVISTCDVYDASAYYGRGLAYDKLGDFHSAIDNYTKAIKANPNYWKAYFNRGCVYYDLKKYELAIRDFSIAIKLNPIDADAYLIRGSAKIKLGRVKDGYRDVRKAYKL